MSTSLLGLVLPILHATVKEPQSDPTIHSKRLVHIKHHLSLPYYQFTGL